MLAVTPVTHAGEPFDNFDAVMKAVAIASDPLGLHFSKNKITVSTVGLVPEIHMFAQTCSAQLAVSLHASSDAVRNSIVPVNRRYPLQDLMACLRCAASQSAAAMFCSPGCVCARQDQRCKSTSAAGRANAHDLQCRAGCALSLLPKRQTASTLKINS
jgi:hypothetical protein